MTSKIVTRFAPSPTGFLHIGGARTALFNWLFAKSCGGEMLLRIEDTDRKRSTDEAIGAILDGLDWLGLQADGEPVYQHKRAERHVEIAQALLEAGNAYRCYCTTEELEEMREQARKQGRSPRYDGICREKDHGESPEDAPYVIRFKSPDSGETVVNDKVQGNVAIANQELDDLILLRSNGSPTYMLSVVVDDHDMGVTHVIRGDDHLTNAARQVQIYEALGWEIPVFAHIPLIHGADGAKLSKRHGALGVEAYRAMGYLPQAMRNYLVRLGWSHGDDEIISLDEMISWFDLDGIGKAPARFDFAKLDHLNSHYIRQMDDKELAETLIDALPHLEGGDELLEKLDEIHKKQLVAAMPGLKERAKTLADLVKSSKFIFAARPLAMEDKAAKLLSNDARAHLAGLSQKLEQIEGWPHDAIEQAVRDFVGENGLKLGQLAQPLRAALTGSTVSPGIFDVLHVLGREEALARINDQLLNQSL